MCFNILLLQWQKNTSKHRVINRTPYEALLGPISCGLSSIPLPGDVLNSVSTEEELEEALSNVCQQNNDGEILNQNIHQPLVALSLHEGARSDLQSTDDELLDQNIDQPTISLLPNEVSCNNYPQDETMNDEETINQSRANENRYKYIFYFKSILHLFHEFSFQ